MKKHPNWVRPGCVWMMEGAKLALFASDASSSCDEHDDDKGEHPIIAAGMDVSPSTENVRGGGNIDRMILVGEYCLVYAWTPEEATSGYVHDEYVKLTERRANLDLPYEAKRKEGGVIESVDEGDEEIGDDDDGDPMGIRAAGGAKAVSRDSLACVKAARDDGIDGSCLVVEPRWSKGSDAIIASDAESDESTPPPPAATNYPFGSTPFEKPTTEGGAGTTVEVDLVGGSKMIEEERKRPSTTIAADFGGPHRGRAAQFETKTTAVSLLTSHEYDDVNDESMPHEKILEIEEESPTVPSNLLAATRRTEREGKTRHDVGQLHIAPTREAPPPTWERNTDGHPAGCANDNKPRPVSCETAASSPHRNIADDSRCRRQHGETINDTEVRNSNPNAPSRPRSVDTFDAGILDEEPSRFFPTVGMAPCSTPKGPNEEQCYSRLRIDTGDSFDDMLDEDDDVSPGAGVGKKDHRTQEENARVHGHDLASRTDSPHVARSDVTDTPPNYLALPAATRAAFLFDTLDGDDLDFLGEEE